jgi:trigger factor
LGLKVGAEKEFSIEYPGTYINKKIAGKCVNFKVKINEIKNRILPDLNDDFAKKVGFNNVEDLKQNIHKQLLIEREAIEKGKRRQQVLEYLVNDNSFELPNSLVEEELNRIMEEQKKQNKDFKKEDLDKLKEKYLPLAEKNVRIFFLLLDISEKEKLRVTKEELDNRMAELSRMSKAKNDREMNIKQDGLYTRMYEDKIFNFLLLHAQYV